MFEHEPGARVTLYRARTHYTIFRHPLNYLTRFAKHPVHIYTYYT